MLSVGPVADFCAELGRLVRACRVPQAEIAERLGKSAASVSELLNGRRRRPPEWDDVRTVVVLCAERYGRGGTPPSGMRLDVEWWRGRYGELERAVESARAPGHRAAKSIEAESPPQDESRAPDAVSASLMGIDVAVELLVAGRAGLEDALTGLIGPLYGEQGTPGVLDALLDGFAERVRAAHGVRRCALLQAARVVLVAASLVACGVSELDEPPGEEGEENGHWLRCEDQRAAVIEIRDVANGGARPGARNTTGSWPVDMSLLAGALADSPDDMRAAFLDQYVMLASPVASTCPEFALVSNLPGVFPSDTADGGSGVALSGLESLLAEFAGRGEYSGAGRALLDGPIASLDPRGPRLPSLADGYVNPRFRLAGQTARGISGHGVASDKWWAEQPEHDTIEHFFAAHLLSLPALLTPLVVLGDPGSGKSLLTKLLTARLPAHEFRPLRVELRHTPAEADVQTQLEDALRRTTGRSTSWPDWYESQPDVVPVVLLDGFDELLQAGAQRLDSNRQWSYLTAVERFQTREAELDRPLIVVVTSRTVVADRAEIPKNSQVLRLEPFTEPEIHRWLTIWNRTNLGYLEQRGLRPLTVDVVKAHPDLAAQPLLLLMLALYDAVDNELHRLRDEDFSRTQLYDRLLREFVRRQVVKDGQRPAAELEAAVDRELHHLSVIALGMFHRGAQAISSEEADRDLTALGSTAAHQGSGDAETLFGRFFFMHEAQAVVVEQRLRSYEFLHATFGEHLAARLIEQALNRLVKSADPGQGPLDDGELYALLSFAPLSDRAQLVKNLREMLAAWTDSPGRREVPGLLARLRAEAEWEPTHRTDLGHTPTRLTRTYREAVYQVNLLLTAVLAAGEVRISEFLATDDVLGTWRRHSALWQSQLSTDSWELLTSVLVPHRTWRPGPNGDGQRPELLIDLNQESLFPHGLNWPIGFPESPSPESVGGVAYHPDGATEDVMRRVAFGGDHDAELLRHIAEPVLVRLPSAMHLYHVDAEGQVQSAARSLIALLIADPKLDGHLPDLYLTCREAVERLPFREEKAGLEAICRRLVHDVSALSDSDLASVLRRILDHKPIKSPVIRQALRDCVRRALGRSEELDAILNELCYAFDLHQWSSSEPEDLVRLTWAASSSTAWKWSKAAFNDQIEDLDFNEILAAHDPGETAARNPTYAIDLLRLAADLGLDDWLAGHAETWLQALPRSVFGLLRPSDLTYLRPALPPGTYAAEFAEVERIWRGPPDDAGHTSGLG